MPDNQVKGIVAYNRIRSALSKEIKAKGIKLEKGAFNTLSTDIFRHNKGKYIDPILDEIGEQITIEREPDVGEFGMLPTLLEGFLYYEFDNEYITMGMHKDLYIVSDFLPEPILAAELDYYEYIAPLVSFIDYNRTQENIPDSDKWFYDYAVILQFTKPEFNPVSMRLESRLYASQIWSVYNDKQLPYEFGMQGYYDPEELLIILSELGKPTIPGEIPEEEPEEPEKIEKAKERKERIEELAKETELEREKGITAKEKRLLLETEERLLDKYTKLYEKGIITKKQLQAKIAKL